MPDNMTDEQWSEIEAALYAGRKIEAIKLFREATGTGLKEAKDAMDKHEAELRETNAEAFKHPAGKAGCSTAVFLLATSIAGATGTVIGWLA